MYSVLFPSLGIGALTALWFGLASFRARKGWPGWAVAGWFIGLVTAGICLGLAQAVCIPISDARRTRDFALAIALALAVSALFGAMATIPLGRSEKPHLRDG